MILIYSCIVIMQCISRGVQCKDYTPVQIWRITQTPQLKVNPPDSWTRGDNSLSHGDDNSMSPAWFPSPWRARPHQNHTRLRSANMINASPERHKFVNGAKLIKVGISCVTAVPVATVWLYWTRTTVAQLLLQSVAQKQQLLSATVEQFHFQKNQLKFC